MAMDKDTERLDALFRDACELGAGAEVKDEWEPGNPHEWDSLANLRLIFVIEKAFNVSLDFDELLALSNWGEFKGLVLAKAGKP
jgi:acyl carrier protein